MGSGVLVWSVAMLWKVRAVMIQVQMVKTPRAAKILTGVRRKELSAAPHAMTTPVSSKKFE